jgi:tRNA A-37 threonylcarbamoyl transferase component Bud32
MNASSAAPNPNEIARVLEGVLHQIHGADAALAAWHADPLSKRGRHRVVRYHLDVHVGGAPPIRRYGWVGKFYEREDEARMVATTLRALAAASCGRRGGFVVPSVLGYDARRRLLLLTYEAGESLTRGFARDAPGVLAAVGRALAVLHAAPLAARSITGPSAVLADVRRAVADLAAQLPGEAASLCAQLARLERRMPAAPDPPSFLHGDMGTAQLLWNAGTLVVLDFDACTHGDPALDLGKLLTQLRRLALRKPGKLPPFGALRRDLFEAYGRWSKDDPSLERRVAWYERATLLRKIHGLVFDTSRHPEAEALERRRGEAIRLLCDIARDSARSS